MRNDFSDMFVFLKIAMQILVSSRYFFMLYF